MSEFNTGDTVYYHGRQAIVKKVGFYFIKIQFVDTKDTTWTTEKELKFDRTP